MNQDMTQDIKPLKNKTYLITGGAKRIGAAIARGLHAEGANVIIHYRTSSDAALQLAIDLNNQRMGSAFTVQADLSDITKLRDLAIELGKEHGKIDGLINNASSYYATPIATATVDDWDDLFNSNTKSAFFLIQACLPLLQTAQGSVVNLVDVNTLKPLSQHSLYCASKAALEMLTKSLAEELAPKVRVNAIAPGAILWSEDELENDEFRKKRLANVPLERKGDPKNIVNAVKYLISAEYVTGQTIAVDGGLSLR